MASAAADDVTRHDVFLSFRGIDTRDTITDHIHEALLRAALRTFRDDDEMERGRDLKTEIETAIKASESSIIVFSKNFATSTWCLDELSLILEQMRDCNHIVLPVFYHVDPSDVRKQNGSFKIEVKDGSPRWTRYNVDRWKAALTMAANLTGIVLKGSETKFVKDIVDFIYNKVSAKKFHLPLNLVRMDTRYEDINDWIKQSDDNLLVIWGMGGSGKTTLARYIVYSNRDKFDNISIVEHIGSIWKEPQHLRQLQETLLGGILGGDKSKVSSDSQGRVKIEQALEMKKSLIVLDDIVNQDQLLALLGTGKINQESKVIVTTRDGIGRWFGSRYGRCWEYKMRLLDPDESLELLSLHAFGSKTPLEEYLNLAKQVVKYCDGNPLALEVLGSTLSQDISIPSWESALVRLDEDRDKGLHIGISRVLKTSYDSLPHDYEKELFLHIACFFNGTDLDYAVKIFEKDYHAVSSLQTLTNRSLLSISPNQKIMMHQLLQDMGRSIVIEESPKNPAQRSRVWLSTESYDMLINGMASEKVEGLALDMQMLIDNKYASEELSLHTGSLKIMYQLKLLSLKHVKVSGSYKNFSNKLSWLCWIGFHEKTIPPGLSMRNLVALDMSNSCLVVFEISMALQALKILDLKDSLSLEKIHNFNMIPKLETLILCNCHKLVHVCETIVGLKSLVFLNMTGCKSLYKSSSDKMLINPLKMSTSTSNNGSTQKPSFPMPCSLERLFLNDCELEYTDFSPLNFSDQLSMQYLNLGNNLFEILPNYIHLKNLRVLNLSSCPRLKSLLYLPSTLVKLDINHCESMEKVTFESHRFTLQELVCEGCTNLSEIEGFIKLVPTATLNESDLGHMKWLKDFQNLEMSVVGYDELTESRTQRVQVLYEFGIMSTSLPDIKIPMIMPKFKSEKTLASVSFKIPEYLKNQRVKGIYVTFKYTISGDEWVWFAKISTANGANFIYNPTVFGRPRFGEVGTWLSYWPIGNMLYARDNVNVSIVVVRGLEVCECDAGLVYTDDEVADETLENSFGWVETLGGDLSAFQLSTEAYYLCRRDFFELMEVAGPSPGWFRTLVGGNIDHAEVRGWRKTGKLMQTNSSTTQFETDKYVIHGPQAEKKTAGASILNHLKNPPISMASGSSSSIMASASANARTYDVYVSFREEDTRRSFTDHLYAALVRSGIHTFRDNGEITRGEELGAEIKRVIIESRASIIVLSENYATSSRCLDELLLILEQRREHNHFVLPLFYHVDPSDVRNQNKTFNMEVKTSKRWTDYKVNQWKTALREVANLTGMVLSGSEAEFLHNVVGTVYSMLSPKQLHVPDTLTGTDAQVQEINSWFEQPDARFLSISGMAGSGKTTLAKCVVNSVQHNFENISILKDIGNRCRAPQDLVQLQKNLLKDIFGYRERNIPRDGIIHVLEEVLQRTKTLIVLDDIVDEDQLVALLGTGNINEQSKIIITTRDDSINKWLCSRSGRCQVYNMELLNNDDSLEIFSLCAFGSRIPMEGYKDIATAVVRYCEGHPLALNVFGHHLQGRSMVEWEDALCRMESKMDYTLYRVFCQSYESLSHGYERELFLHIACFLTDKDLDYVVKIVGHEFNALSGINTLINKHLISVSPNKKLMMHRLHQEMGRTIADEESDNLLERSRVWRNEESYEVLKKGKGSQRMQGLALDMRKFSCQSANFRTDVLRNMDNLKLLQLNFVQLDGSSYKNFPKHLRWLSWHGFHLRTIPSDLYMGNMVAIDMSYSKLQVFEPPVILSSLRFLNLEDSHNLKEVRNIFLLPNLENLNLSCCHILDHVCETLINLTNLTVLNMTKCKKLFMGKKLGLLSRFTASIVNRSTTKPPFSLPHSPERLFLNDCNLENYDYLTLCFSDQSFLQYLNLANNLFELLPSYNHLINLRVLDLTLCSRLKQLASLPSTLAELYINNCELLEKVTFESHRFTLHVFEYEGCINLLEIEGIFKMQPISELDASDLRHMKGLKEYQNHEVCLVGNNGLSITRSCCVQMLHEFDIMSTSLPDTNDPNMAQYVSESSSVCFDVPTYPRNRRLKGLNVTFKYRISGDDLVWFAKINTKGVDLIYNPSVFGKPGLREVGLWFSYWPIGNKLDTGDKVNVSIVVLSGLEVIECGASLVYTYDVANETLENKTGWVETLGGDLSGFQLSTGAYYLCRRDLFEVSEVGRLTPDWLRILIGDTVDETEVRGWKITGRPKQTNKSSWFTDLN